MDGLRYEKPSTNSTPPSFSYKSGVCVYVVWQSIARSSCILIYILGLAVDTYIATTRLYLYCSFSFGIPCRIDLDFRPGSQSATYYTSPCLRILPELCCLTFPWSDDGVEVCRL
jgi:hypothetical protein